MSADELTRKIRERESEIRDITRKYDDIDTDFIKKDKIFKDSKAYMDEVLKQIHEAKATN